MAISLGNIKIPNNGIPWNAGNQVVYADMSASPSIPVRVRVYVNDILKDTQFWTSVSTFGQTLSAMWTPTGPGTATVKFVAWEEETAPGCSYSYREKAGGAHAEKTVTVNLASTFCKAPYAWFTFTNMGGGNSDTAGYAPAACTFNASTNSAGSIYIWDFGDGGTATGSSVTHTFAAKGSYHVKLTVNSPSCVTGGSLLSNYTTRLVNVFAPGEPISGSFEINLDQTAPVYTPTTPSVTTPTIAPPPVTTVYTPSVAPTVPVYSPAVTPPAAATPPAREGAQEDFLSSLLSDPLKLAAIVGTVGVAAVGGYYLYKQKSKGGET